MDAIKMPSGFGELLVAICFLYLGYFSGLLFYRLTVHPLSRFPGPKLAAASSLYELLYDVILSRGRGRLYYEKIEEMHDLYGPIVRVAPNELHIKDSAFYTTLHANSPARRDKHHSTANATGAVETTFATQQHDLHKRRRTPISPLFSKRSINRSYSMIVQQVAILSENLQQFYSSGDVVDLHRTLLAFTSDTVSHFMIGFSTELQTHSEKAYQWESAMHSLFEMIPITMKFPVLIDLLLKLPESILLTLSPKLAAVLQWRKGFFAAAAGKQSNPDIKYDHVDGTTQTLFQAIQASDLPPSDKSPERMGIEAESVATGGSETTATAITQAIYQLLAHPSTLNLLRKEILSLYSESNQQPSLASLQELPCLTGVIKETLRISPIIIVRLPLLSHTDLQYGKWRIPAMTPVSTSITDVHFDPEIFPEPNKFRPERWITVDGKKSTQHDKFFVPFGRGHRMCLGYELAYAEMYLGLAMIVRKFDLQLFDTDWERDVKVKRDCFLGLPGLDSRGVRVKVTGMRD